MQERLNRGFPLFKLNRYGIALTGVALVAAIAGGLYKCRSPNNCHKMLLRP